MAKVEKVAPKQEEPVTEPNHTEKIKSQVLAKIGKPPRLDRVEVSRHHNGNYRVNIWEQPEPVKDVAVTISARIRSSYYLKVADTGEIIGSNPPLAKLCCST
jgi:ABC-type Zn2+ transport system substrate-binding protein/surface adhesin